MLYVDALRIQTLESSLGCLVKHIKHWKEKRPTWGREWSVARPHWGLWGVPGGDACFWKTVT